MFARALTFPSVLALAPLVAAAACGDAGGVAWAGSVDTLASGRVVVRNPDVGLWTPAETWTLTEELRLGSTADEGPDLFGRISSVAVDRGGRIYVLEALAQELRVFDREGGHVRTIGREGGGPGEFSRAVRAELGPDGNLWVADPQSNRVSVFDTTGAYLESRRAAGGFVILPWPGRFDRHGHYYYPVPLPSEEGFRIGLAKYDEDFAVLDTLAVPTDPVDRHYFEHRAGENRFARASVPFSGAFRWKISPAGTFWGLLTGEYRLFELDQAGDTLRTVTRDFDPLPVTDADVERAREALEWFTEQGGEVDWSRVPDRKPAAEGFFVDDDGYVWVWPVTPRGEDGTRLDVFDPTGRYLGAVTPPVAISRSPTPVVRDGYMYAVTESELEVPFVVRFRIENRP